MPEVDYNGFRRIAEMIGREAGISLPENKIYLVQGRLNRRIQELGENLSDYAERCANNPDEMVRLIDALTTNHTAWMREPDHFEDLAKRVLPQLAASGRGPRTIKIWCAAASTGEEPYSIALTVAKWLREHAGWSCAILATDISTRALAKVRTAEYGEDRISCLSPEDRRLAVESVPGSITPTFRVTKALRDMVKPARLNLMGDWPMKGPFDIIFCRNVMIYFDRPTQERLVNRMAALLAVGGTLYTGHAESLGGIKHSLTIKAPATYVR